MVVEEKDDTEGQRGARNERQAMRLRPENSRPMTHGVTVSQSVSDRLCHLTQ